MKIKYLILSVFILTIFSSCLRYNLDELPAFSEAKITGISGEYRYLGPQTWVTGENVVINKGLGRTSMNIDTVAMTVTATFRIPDAESNSADTGWNTEERQKVSLSNIVCYFTISTAAKITPIEGAPVLGVPGDWNGAKKYEVKAANGTKKIWTVTVTITP